MSETKPEGQPEEKRRIVFRNAGTRQFHLRKRPDQLASETAFVLEPGATVQALDEAEEVLLSGYHDLRNVEKESPAIANTLSTLQQQLNDAKAENAKLRDEKAGLEQKVEETKAQREARTRPSK